MTYKSSSQKNKLTIAELDNRDQSNIISLQKQIELLVNQRVNKTQPRDLNISNLVNFDSDWLDMDVKIINAIPIETWKSFEVFIGRINLNWINNFHVGLICRSVPAGMVNFQLPNDNYFKKVIGWNIKDVVGSETSDIKDVTLIASIYLDYSVCILKPLLQVNLLIKYINQSLHD